MAGSYNDAPSRRFAYDDDGTIVLRSANAETAVPIELTGPQVTLLNSEESTAYNAADTVAPQGNQLGFLFPELREIDGIFGAVAYQAVAMGFGEIFASDDTTAFFDGTWDSIIGDLPNFNTVYDKYRDNITATAEPTRAGLKMKTVGGGSGAEAFAAVHLYGTISPGETPDRILFLDTLNADAEFTKVLDYGDVPRGQTQQRTFKIKNNSASKIINTVQVTTTDLHLNAAGWYTYSDDDISYQATFSVGNLGIGATKLLYIKQAIPDAETLGLQAARIKVTHASLT